jgi:hypothetical protein
MCDGFGASPLTGLLCAIGILRARLIRGASRATPPTQESAVPVRFFCFLRPARDG